MEEKQYLIDQITDMALGIYVSRALPMESYRNFTIYCNKETHTMLEEELMEKANGITYIQVANEKLRKESGAIHVSVNGLRITFKIGEEYSVLAVFVDALVPIEDR